MVGQKKKSMSNIPMSFTDLIPPGFYKGQTIIIYEKSKLSIDSDGIMILEGTAKGIALGLLKYVIEEQWSPGMTSFELNHALRIECRDSQFHLFYMKENKPDFFDELTREFNRLVNMKAFW
jgi:hypothetical protein